MVRPPIARCVICRKMWSSLLTQNMSYLPKDRLGKSPPFTNTGRNAFEPFLINDWANTRLNDVSGHYSVHERFPTFLVLRGNGIFLRMTEEPISYLHETEKHCNTRLRLEIESTWCHSLRWHWGANWPTLLWSSSNGLRRSVRLDAVYKDSRVFCNYVRAISYWACWSLLMIINASDYKLVVQCGRLKTCY